MEITANSKVARKRPEPDPRAHHNEEYEGECVDKVGENVERAEKTLTPGAYPQSKWVQEEEYHEATHEPVEDPGHHERASHVPMVRAHEVHDTDLVAGSVNGKPHRIKGNKKR